MGCAGSQGSVNLNLGHSLITSWAIVTPRSISFVLVIAALIAASLVLARLWSDDDAEPRVRSRAPRVSQRQPPEVPEPPRRVGPDAGAVAPAVPVTPPAAARVMADDMSDIPPLDPYDPVVTGDEVYDRQARVAAAQMLYDHQSYEDAVALATELLREDPDNIRMHLLLVLSACAMGREGLARAHYRRLPVADRHRAHYRCSEAGIEFAGDRPQ
ncbi:MAG: hypothetical protein Tsb0020_32860 [Haliangiales bacterium]